MKLKLKLTEEEFNTLGEDVKKLYAKNGEDYVLEVEGVEDTGALKRAKDYEKQQRQAAEKAAKELKDQLAAIQSEMEDLREKAEAGGKKKNTETEALERSWQKKLEAREKELMARIETAENSLKSQAVNSIAMKLAADLAGENAEIILPHIQRRLVGELQDGKPTARVLGADGQPSALTPEELHKEFLSNDRFASIVIGSKASGGGAGGARKGGGGATKKLSEMTATEESVFANQHPEEYKKMLEQEQKPA